MPIMTPAPADKEIASATFKLHLDNLWKTGRPARLGWERIDLGPLHVVVKLPGHRPDGTRDEYYFKLGAEYYDAAPPTVELVEPVTWSHPPASSKWFPIIEPRPAWFGLHEKYGFPDGTHRQLVCFTFAAEYYMTDHSPKESEKWQQGRHTVSATLSRLAEVLAPPYYKRPAG